MRRFLPLAALLSLTTTILASAPVETRSVQAGVFTQEQADRGRALFENICRSCHALEEFGGSYLESWSTLPMSDLIDKIRAEMPQDAPGSLKRSEYVDIGAFLLDLNGLPKGESEMDATSVKEILIEGPFGPR
jgi:hypothetical protein